MRVVDFSKLTALVVDDFSSFRSTMMSMLNKLGLKSIEEAPRASDALKWCEERQFDFLLCDYNLGAGRTGQHILEELRHKKLISRQTMFVMVTAEASKEMVLSAYDCEPDDYLMKPLNLRVLEQRLTRLVEQRDAFAEIHQQVDNGSIGKAIELLEKISKSGDRQSSTAQRLLGEIYLKDGRLPQAEALYQQVLGERSLDWACLGLARVQQAKGALKESRETLEALMTQSRLYLPAYDALSSLCEQTQDTAGLQRNLERVVELSPKSILRQRYLSRVAERNGDIEHTLLASQEAIKLGDLSSHKDPEDTLLFLKAAGNALELGVTVGNMDLVDECRKNLSKAKAAQQLTGDQESQANVLAARALALNGKKDEAGKLIQGEEALAESRENRDIGVDLAMHAYLESDAQYLEADALVASMVQRYSDNPEYMEKIDKLLPEPRSEVNRHRVLQLNKEGIKLYKDGLYQDALACFQRAEVMFPRNIGVRLNRIQSLIGVLRSSPSDADVLQALTRAMQAVEQMIGGNQHPQAARFQQLKTMATAAMRQVKGL